VGRNICGPTPVTVVLRGRVHEGIAKLISSDATTQVHIALS
jgi:hypothetical protein